MIEVKFLNTAQALKRVIVVETVSSYCLSAVIGKAVAHHDAKGLTFSQAGDTPHIELTTPALFGEILYRVNADNLPKEILQATIKAALDLDPKDDNGLLLVVNVGEGAPHAEIRKSEPYLKLRKAATLVTESEPSKGQDRAELLEHVFGERVSAKVKTEIAAILEREVKDGFIPHASAYANRADFYETVCIGIDGSWDKGLAAKLYPEDGELGYPKVRQALIRIATRSDNILRAYQLLIEEFDKHFREDPDSGRRIVGAVEKALRDLVDETKMVNAEGVSKPREGAVKLTNRQLGTLSAAVLKIGNAVRGGEVSPSAAVVSVVAGLYRPPAP